MSFDIIRKSTVMLAAAALAGGCGSDLLPRAQAPVADTGQSKCRVAGGDANPLVTEWPASEKANLELRLREGGVAVSYTGCELRLISGCRLGGRYEWHRTTPSTDVIEMNSVDDLYAKLPIGAVSLEGALSQSGRLAMRTTVAGQLRLSGASAARDPRCGQATHVISAMSVGAFRLSSGGGMGARLGADTPIGGLGGGTKSEESLMREAGDPQRCRESSDGAAHPECRSPIQLFLSPLGGAPVARPTYPTARPTYPTARPTYPPRQPPPAAPATTAAPRRPPPVPDPPSTAAPTPSRTAAPPPTTTAAPPPSRTAAPAPTAPATAPPPTTTAAPPSRTAAPVPTPTRTAPATTAKPWLPPAPKGQLGPGATSTAANQPSKSDGVDTIVINLKSDEPDATFVLSASGKALCTSPCSKRVRVDDLATVKELGGPKKSEPMTVTDLRSYSVAGAVDVTASPRSTAKQWGGIALAAIGGIGMLAGFVVAIVGGKDDNVGMQVGGGIMAGLGPAAMIPGVIFMATFKEELLVSPAKGVDLTFGPGSLFGRF